MTEERHAIVEVSRDTKQKRERKKEEKLQITNLKRSNVQNAGDESGSAVNNSI
jgi:hypothetical protein